MKKQINRNMTLGELEYKVFWIVEENITNNNPIVNCNGTTQDFLFPILLEYLQ